jgi:hypothetical protein
MNNPTEDHRTLWKLAIASAKRWAWQIERGEEGTPHIQGAVHYAEAVRFSTLQKLLPGFHLETCR